MKKIKTLLCCLALWQCAFPRSRLRQVPKKRAAVRRTREQCNKIVETAIEEYHIVVPDMEEYKAYIWDMAKKSGLTANAVETQFQADFGKAAERKKFNEKRAADVYINSAEEAMAALDEINAEKHTATIWASDRLRRKQTIWTRYNWTKRRSKKELEHEMKKQPRWGELVEKTRDRGFQ